MCLPNSIEIDGSTSLPEVVRRWNLIDKIKGQWKWVIFPRNFESKRLEEPTLWQSWTIRRAIFSETH